MVLPVVRPETFSAHIQKLAHELERGEGRVSPAGLLLTTMADNTELAAEILSAATSLGDEESRNLALAIACVTYQSLKAQAESDSLEA